MYLINNRYRIIDNISHNTFISSFSAIDLTENNELVKLNVINSDSMSKSLRRFLINEFTKIKNIESSNILRLYSFDSVFSMDNRRRSDINKIFYTNEYFESKGDISQYINDLSDEQLLCIFISLCQNIRYLHHVGFVYNAIEPSNILISAKDESVKIKDIITVILEKSNYWNYIPQFVYFQSPETINGSIPSTPSDIYSLGVLLLTFCMRELPPEMNVELEIEKIKALQAENKSIFYKLIPLIEKMTDHNITIRPQSINEVIYEVNSILSTNYVPHIKEDLEKLHTYTRIVGREFEIEKVLNSFNSLVEKKEENKYIMVHGEAGIGKSRFLHKLKSILSFENANVYYCNLSKKQNEEYSPIKIILKQFILECDKEILSKYEEELARFMPEVYDNKPKESSIPLKGDMEKFRLMNRIVSLATEHIAGRTTVFIIDDIHLIDDFTSEFIKYVFNRKKKNCMFIYSYSDNCSKNENITKFLNQYKHIESTIDIHLRELSLKFTHEMMVNILFIPTLNDSFVEKIYSKTFGNPRFIQETIKNLFAEKVIYINDEGNWYTDYSAVDLPLPSSIEQAVLYQLKEFREEEIELLNTLCIFNSAVPKAILKNLLDQGIDNLDNNINILTDKGIIEEKIEDFGYAYDFTNALLKNLIYSEIDQDIKINMHSKAAKVLREFYCKGRKNNEEIIYHLEKCQDNESIIEYCLDNADIMKKLKNRTEEIKNIKKALTFFDKDSACNRKLNLYIRLSEVFYQEGNYSNAIRYYKMAESNAALLLEEKTLTNILNKISYLYFLKNDIKKSGAYIEKAEVILDNAVEKDYFMEEKLDLIRNKVEILIYNKEYNHAYKMLKESLNLCGNKYLKQKGIFEYSLGNLYFLNSKVEDAIECLTESCTYFRKLGLKTEISNSLNKIAFIYAEYYQDYDKAIEFYNLIRNISEENSLSIPEILANISLGDCYSNLLEYNKAYVYYKEGLQLALKTDNEKYIFLSYSYLNIICIKLGFYKETYSYYRLQKLQIKQFSQKDRDLDNFYYAEAVVLQKFGHIEASKDSLEKAMLFYADIELKSTLDLKLLDQHIKLLKIQDDEEIEDNIREINTIINKFKHLPGRLEAIVNTGILLAEIGRQEYSLYYLKQGEAIEKSSLNKRLEAAYYYLKALHSKGSKKISYFDKALVICSEENILETKWKVLFNIGEYYRKSNRLYAVNYYFESCEVIKTIMLSVPRKYQLKYLSVNNGLKPFNSLISMKQKDKSFTINSLKELNHLFTYRDFNHILTDKALTKTARNIFYKSLPVNIDSLEDLIENLNSDSKHNFNIILNYVSKFTLATKAALIIDNRYEGYVVFSTNNDKNISPENKLILDRVRNEKKPILITSLDMLSSNQKAVICIPIFSGNNLLGYLYLESYKYINDFNKESLNRCTSLNNLMSILIEKYQLKVNSSIDRLTETLTRKATEEALEQIIENSQRDHSNFSVIMFDLDNFKSVNDSYGHQTGDMVLKSVCRIVLNNLSGDAACGRFGGEEFVVILPDMIQEDAMKTAETLRIKIENEKILGENRPVTVSVGLATYPFHGENQKELIEKADQALYVAKKTGKNKCQLWQDGFSNKANVTNKLAGIFTGNLVQDYRNISVLIEIIDLIKTQDKAEDKIFKFLGRIIEITESQNGMFFIIENNKIERKYSRKIFIDEWSELEYFNEDIIKNTIGTMKGTYTIDWDNFVQRDVLTGLPDWLSVMIIPVINKGCLIGILYLSVPLREKEFSFNDYNFVENLAQISAALF